MKKTLTLLTAILLISCGSDSDDKEIFEASCDIGKLNYKIILIDAITNDSIIDFNKLDSIYEARIKETSKRIYDEK